MIARIIIFLLAVVPLNQMDAGLWDTITSYFKKPEESTIPPSIRVLVIHDKVGTVLEVKGKYRIYDPNTGEYISTRFTGKRKFIQTLKNGLKWGEEFPGVHQIMIVPDNDQVTVVVDGIEYAGNIFVYDIGGTISIVNEILIEDYLNSILTTEYRESLPEEAYATIAIAARTNAYYQIENPKNKFWDVDGAQVGYHGHAVAQKTSGIQKAITATRYMIMTKNSRNDQIEVIPAIWSLSRIPLAEAINLAKEGDHAAQILTKAFPGIRIQLIQYSKAEN